MNCFPGRKLGLTGKAKKTLAVLQSLWVVLASFDEYLYTSDYYKRSVCKTPPETTWEAMDIPPMRRSKEGTKDWFQVPRDRILLGGARVRPSKSRVSASSKDILPSPTKNTRYFVEAALNCIPGRRRRNDRPRDNVCVTFYNPLLRGASNRGSSSPRRQGGRRRKGLAYKSPWTTAGEDSITHEQKETPRSGAAPAAG